MLTKSEETTNSKWTISWRQRVMASVLVTALIVGAVTLLSKGQTRGGRGPSRSVFLHKNGQASRETKLHHGVVSDIYDGIIVKDHDYPYYVALHNSRFGDGRAGYICGGILFKQDFVLTAAHCIQRWDDSANYEAVANLYVTGGFGGLTDPEMTEAEAQHLSVEYMIKHDGYIWNTGGDDIAILYLELDGFTLKDKHIETAPLAKKSTRYPTEGDRVAMLGIGPYGNDGAGHTIQSNNIRRGYSSVMTFDGCQHDYPAALNGNREFCMDDADKKYEICKGDSGSPILDTHTYKVIGLVTKGNRHNRFWCGAIYSDVRELDSRDATNDSKWYGYKRCRNVAKLI